jgi:hypothetical protein
LLSQYYHHEASKQHDKVYALLGMCTDDVQDSGLLPDYALPWHELQNRLLRHMVGDTVRICTWIGQEVAMISGQGHIFGTVAPDFHNGTPAHLDGKPGPTFYLDRPGLSKLPLLKAI